MKNEPMNVNKKTIIYIDLDNTLVNFKSGVKKCSEETKAKYACDEEGKPHFDDIPGIFALMKPMPGAEDAFKFLAAHFDVYILSTAPWNNPSAWCDKLNWVKKYLDGEKKGKPAFKRLILSHHKNLNRGDFLIDDSTNNGAGEFEGKHILFGSPEFPNWPAVIAYFKNLLSEQ